MSQPLLLQGSRFALQHERAAGGQAKLKESRGERHFQRLPADGVAAAVVEFVVDDRLAAGGGPGLDPALFVAQPHDLADHEHLPLGVLLGDARPAAIASTNALAEPSQPGISG